MKKIISTTAALLMIAAVSLPVSASNLPNIPNMPVSEQKLTSYYGSYSGTVQEINKIDDRNVCTIKDEENNIADITVTADTYVIGDRDIKKGDKIEGYYYMLSPMLMIYPPRVTADVVTVNFTDKQFLTVNRFDENLISADNMLKLNISPDTEVVLQDGNAYGGDFANRCLAVLYTVTTRSIPAQTTPSKVIVLFEKPIPAEIPAALLPQYSSPPTGSDSSIVLEDLNGEIVVKGVKIAAPKPYLADNGKVMIPLRAAAEALGYEVKWESESKTIWLNDVISLSIGKDYYTFAKMAPVNLGNAPELKNDFTYVPLNFFTDIMRITNAYISKGQVVIDNNIFAE